VLAVEWTFHSHLGAASTIGGVLLWLLEVFAALLSCAYLREICDALGTEHWRRRITPATRLSMPDSELPMISRHVPAHNEPPAMVIETLRSLLQPQRLSVRVTQSEHLVCIPVRVPVRDRHAHTISHRPLATLFAEFVTRYAGRLFCK
jgi:hypothetical protein